MPRYIHLFDSPDRFITGTVGQPGDRTFFLQARSGNRIVSVALEKEQAALLSDRLEELIKQVSAIESIVLAETAPADLEPLDNPISEEFRVGTIALGWNSTLQQVVIEAHAVTDGFEDVPDLESDETEGPDVLRVRITPTAAKAFWKRTNSIVAAGRPPCPLCNEVLDPSGHICPRANGYRRRG